MKRMKKVLAMLLAFAMVMGMSLTTFAAENNEEVKVYGVSEEDTVKVYAYQIIKYNSIGYYEEVLPESITLDEDGNLSPSSSDVAKLALRLNEITTVKELTKDSGKDYYSSDELAAGTWMIIVKGSTEYLYNPAIVSIQQGPDGLVYGELNLETDTWADNLYLKKNAPTVTKTAKEVTTNDNVNGVQFADKIEYTVKFKVPSYTPEVTGMKLVVTDTLVDAKLVELKDVSVAGAKEVDVTALKSIVNTAVVKEATSFTFEINNKQWLLDNAEKEVTVVYIAEVTAQETKEVDELTNTVTYSYTTNDGLVTKDDSTIHYTFSIDGEFVKVGETETTFLDGAVFELHIGSADGTLFTDAAGNKTFTTAEGGKLVIRGLDSDTVYYLVEKIAPTGYTINENPIKVEFEADFDQDGKYKSHAVKVNGNEFNDENPFKFANTKLSALPSTGGIGTAVFTIGGCAIMVAAAYFFFASRKKES